MSLNIGELKTSFSTVGIVRQIMVRPEKWVDPICVDNASVTIANGLQGDHYSGHSKKRQITLIQLEHLDVIAALVHRPSINAALLRRNILVSGINLLALKECEFSIGTARLKMTGLCHPCSRMEKLLGPGGYNAMRGHGGITATVLKDGEIHLGDSVTPLEFVV